jgi:chromosomal replication initiation ATPase DnaA
VLDYFSKRSRPSLLGDEDFKLHARRLKQINKRKSAPAAKPGMKRPAINKVVTVVAGTFNVSPRSIVQAARGPGSKNVPRWVAMYLCQELGGATLQEIAEQFGLQRYGTVSTTIGKFKNESQNDAKLQQQVRRLESALAVA